MTKNTIILQNRPGRAISKRTCPTSSTTIENRDKERGRRMISTLNSNLKNCTNNKVYWIVKVYLFFLEKERSKKRSKFILITERRSAREKKTKLFIFLTQYCKSFSWGKEKRWGERYIWRTTRGNNFIIDDFSDDWRYEVANGDRIAFIM